MEKYNQKARTAKREYNNNVRKLVAYVRRLIREVAAREAAAAQLAAERAHCEMQRRALHRVHCDRQIERNRAAAAASLAEVDAALERVSWRGSCGCCG